MKKPKSERFTKRTFNWGIKSTEISFMRVSPAEAAMDGSSSDCGCVTSNFVPRRKRRLAEQPRRQ